MAALPDGQVVLPGLDRHLDEASWSAVEADEGHPQFGLARLLRRLGIRREDVRDWPEPAAADDAARRDAPPARVRLIAEALRPAGTTEAWARKPLDGDTLAAALGPDLSRVVCRDPGEEARVIALAFRRTLDTPGKTATLVTPDRDLGRRVAAEMQRWGVNVDDSAGQPLAATPPASFLLLLARAVEDGLAPTGLLALLKHPLCAAGQTAADTRRQARALERAALRGARPAAGIDGLRRRLAAARDDRFGPGAAVCDEAAALVDRLAGLLAPLLAETPRDMPDYLRTLCSAAAALADVARRSGRPPSVGRRCGRSPGPVPRRVGGGKPGSHPDSPARPGLAARHADARPGRPPALRRPPAARHPGPARSPAAPCRPDDPGRAERRHLAAGSAGRSVDEPADAPAIRPALAGAPDRPLGARFRPGLLRAGGPRDAQREGRWQPDRRVALAPAPRHRARRRARRGNPRRDPKPGRPPRGARARARPAAAGRKLRPADAAAAGRRPAAQAVGHADREVAARSLHHLRPLHPAPRAA